MRSDFYSLWKLTQNKKHSEKHATRRASVERLEDRQLLAVTAVAALELAAPVESPAEVRAYDACDDFGPVELGAASYNSVNTLVVNTAADTLDDGSLSLRQAMLTANDGDKIVFSPALGDNVVINVTSPLKIASSVSVEGAGRVTIAGNDTFGLLEMDGNDWRGESHDVSISGLTFTHGSGRKGVAIGGFDDALTVSNCVFTDNGNTVDSELMWTEGGGISQAGGSPTLLR